MTENKRIEAMRLFHEANNDWFEDGFTVRALARYRAATESDPADPVAHYQFARALWGFSRADEARAVLTVANAHRDRLSPRGLELLAKATQEMSGSPSFQMSSPVPVSELDVERLSQKVLSSDQWIDIAYAASERAMYGLAIHAFERSHGSFHSRELEEERNDAERQARAALNRLYTMRCEPDRTQFEEISSAPGSFAPSFSSPSPAQRPPPPPDKMDTRHAFPSAPMHRPVPNRAAPLAIEIDVSPLRSMTEAPVTMQVDMSNRSDRPVASNTRMLLNHPSAPPMYGEIYLQVEGPPGYENLVQFSVRAGAPQAEHLRVLAPGERVSKRYALLNYESLHLPGTYTIWVTYRNTVKHEVEGKPLFTGAVSSQAITLERIDA